MAAARDPHLPQSAKTTEGSGPHPLWIRLSAFLSLRAPNTQDTYLGIVREWCCFLGGEFGSAAGARAVMQATDLHAIAYRSWLEGRPGERPRGLAGGPAEVATKAVDQRRAALHRRKKEGLESTLSNATIAKKFAALRRIYRMWIGASIGVRENPFDADRVPPPPKESGRKRPTEMVSFAVVKRIIDLPERNTPKGLRDRAILSVLFGGGLRRSEVSNLRVGDVMKSAGGTLFLYLRATKAKRDAQQALPAWAAETVRALVAARRVERASDGDYLFVSYTGRGGTVATRNRVSASGIYKLFKSYCQRAGASEFATPHSARATAITRLLDSGVPHREVQEFSRHSSIQMVELYDKRRIAVDKSAAKSLDFDE